VKIVIEPHGSFVALDGSIKDTKKRISYRVNNTVHVPLFLSFYVVYLNNKRIK